MLLFASPLPYIVYVKWFFLLPSFFLLLKMLLFASVLFYASKMLCFRFLLLLKISFFASSKILCASICFFRYFSFSLLDQYQSYSKLAFQNNFLLMVDICFEFCQMELVAKPEPPGIMVIKAVSSSEKHLPDHPA